MERTAGDVDIRICFSCNNPLIVGSRDKNTPIAEFRTFAIRSSSHHGKQGRYPILFERVVYQADNLSIGGSSIGDTVFVCEPCFTKQAKGFRKNMAEIFMAKLRSRSVNLVAELFDSNLISVGSGSAVRLKELEVKNLAGILSALQRKQKDEIVPELILALFESGVIIFDVNAKEIFEGLDCEHAEFIITGLNALLSDMRGILPSPAIENLMNRLDCVQAFITADDTSND